MALQQRNPHRDKIIYGNHIWPPEFNQEVGLTILTFLAGCIIVTIFYYLDKIYNHKAQDLKDLEVKIWRLTF